MFRSMHTIKGAAYVVGCVRVGELAHRAEDLLVAVREGDASLSPPALEALFAAVDALKLMLGLTANPDASVTAVAADVHGRLKEYFQGREVPADRGSVTGRAALEARVVQVSDVLADPDYTWSGAQEIGGYRSALGAPLLRKGDVVGVIFVAKKMPQPFTAKQIELVTTFADQALIAIENARLFAQLESRNQELNQALEQQTATSAILRVIASSPTDLKPVLSAVAESAARLCGADDAQIFQFQIEHVGRRVDKSQGAVDLESVGRGFGFEPLGENHLNDVAGLDVFLCSDDRFLESFLG